MASRHSFGIHYSRLLPFTAALALCLGLPAPAAELFPGRQIQTGCSSTGVTIADFDADGVMDMAVRGCGVTIMLGVGGGNFAAPMSLSFGRSANSVGMNNFNGDVAVGTVVGNAQSGDDTMLPGVGGGNIAAPMSLQTGRGDDSIDTNDLNGDGVLDLVIGNMNGGDVSIFLGVGDGTFGPAVNFPVGPSPQSVAIGELTGDGVLDVAVTHQVDLTNTGGSVTILKGSGDGLFVPWRTFPAGLNPTRIALADFNADGHLDVVVEDEGRYNGHDHILIPGAVLVYLSAADGNLGPPMVLTSPDLVSGVAVGDVNSDGASDIVVAQSSITNGHFTESTAEVSVFLGVGDGGFAAPVLTSNTFLTSVALHDLDGDGNLDLVGGGHSGAFGRSEIAVLYGVGDGSFAAPQFFIAGVSPVGVAAGDLNGDGRPDLAVANRDIFSFPRGVTLLVQSGNGRFGGERFSFGQESVFSLVAADFDADGMQDLAAAVDEASTSAVVIYHGGGDGSFTRGDRIALVNRFPMSIRASDFNGDGHTDLALVDHTPVSGDGAIDVLFGVGNGSFSAPVAFPVGLLSGLLSMDVGDVNGDRNPDLVTAGNDSVSILLGAGDGSFGPAGIFPVGLTPVEVALGDLDGDGDLDIATVNRESDDVSILLGVGDGSFPTPVSIPIPAVNNHNLLPSSLTLGDFNADGVLDLAVANYAADTVSVILGVGDGSFLPPVEFQTGSLVLPSTPDSPTSITAADLNADGDLDLVVANSESMNVSVLLGAGDGSFSLPTNYASDFRPFGVVAHDLNGDGGIDLAISAVSSFAKSFVVLLNQSPPVLGDLNADRVVNGFDLAFLLGRWGPCPACLADLNADGVVDTLDLATLLSGWGG